MKKHIPEFRYFVMKYPDHFVIHCITGRSRRTTAKIDQSKLDDEMLNVNRGFGTRVIIPIGEWNRMPRTPEEAEAVYRFELMQDLQNAKDRVEAIEGVLNLANKRRFVRKT